MSSRPARWVKESIGSTPNVEEKIACDGSDHKEIETLRLRSSTHPNDDQDEGHSTVISLRPSQSASQVHEPPQVANHTFVSKYFGPTEATGCTHDVREEPVAIPDNTRSIYGFSASHADSLSRSSKLDSEHLLEQKRCLTIAHAQTALESSRREWSSGIPVPWGFSPPLSSRLPERSQGTNSDALSNWDSDSELPETWGIGDTAPVHRSVSPMSSVGQTSASVFSMAYTTLHQLFHDFDDDVGTETSNLCIPPQYGTQRYTVDTYMENDGASDRAYAYEDSFPEYPLGVPRHWDEDAPTPTDEYMPRESDEIYMGDNRDTDGMCTLEGRMCTSSQWIGSDSGSEGVGMEQTSFQQGRELLLGITDGALAERSEISRVPKFPTVSKAEESVGRQLKGHWLPQRF
ncbi:hypothetical protein BXZ70DRAFT_422515 [Cristinia sonorae]|uniref:Uncharacterized protein n=1 Tax=Cristinia sonorae TaxID=1940300 RepID=A0A8K0XTU9_9AGAR|nr:hypothetical protein BXZ70DRAFT_422515 [Cristinia sonorae]